ncbi:MAG: efflux RND transporter periplasmic adaptor subunit [bacterium]
MKKSFLKRFWWVGLVILAGTFWGGRRFLHKRSVEEETIKVQRGEIRKVIVASGRLEPVWKVEVKSKASGIVKQILVEEGNAVKEGELLLVLDEEQLRARLEKAEANLSAAEAELARVKRGATPLQIAQAEDALRKAEVQKETAQQELARIRELHGQNFASQEELERAEAKAQLALLEWESTKKTLEILKSLPLPEEVAHAEAVVRQAKALRDDAYQEWLNSRVFAPASGIVLKKYVNVGTTVVSALAGLGQGTLLFLIGDPSLMKFLGFVDESDIGYIKPGMEVELSVDAYPGEKFRGTLKKISPQAEERGGVMMFPIELQLDNREGKLFSGMSASAQIIAGIHHDALILPEDAFLFEQNKSFVFRVLRKGKRILKKEKTEVTIGWDEGEKVEVLSGVQEGDEVLAKAPRKKVSFFEQ